MIKNLKIYILRFTKELWGEYSHKYFSFIDQFNLWPAPSEFSMLGYRVVNVKTQIIPSGLVASSSLLLPVIILWVHLETHHLPQKGPPAW